MGDILLYLPPWKPVLQIFLGLAVGLFLASLLESLNVTKKIAVLTRPFVKYAHLSDISAASFALALFSPASANAMLGEALRNKQISEKEAVISNLFNSLPSTLTHIPTFFFMSFPILGRAAVIYTSISVCTACFRTAATILVGRFFLPECTYQKEIQNAVPEEKPVFWKQALKSAYGRFRKRLPRLLFIGIPVFCLMFYLQKFGFFDYVEKLMVDSLGFGFVKPESLSVIVLYMAAELRASLVAAGAVYQAGILTANEVVLALMIGNVLSTPMRGIRHQLPAYASYYPGTFAVKILFYNQFSRVLSMALVAVGFYLIAF